MIETTTANRILTVVTGAWIINVALTWFELSGAVPLLNTLLPGLILGTFAIPRRDEK